MSDQLVLSLDAMGGDDAPGMVLEGVRLAHQCHPGVHFLLFGDEAVLGPQVCEGMRRYCSIRHAPDVVGSADKPAQALRQRRTTSMWLAIKSVKDGEASGVVSAGNTGALMAMAKLALRMLPGIDRPAIAALLPTERRESVVLDLGANAECNADHLVQFAVMGSVFARILLNLGRPSVGLLNIGSEDQKGTESLRQASSILRSSDPLMFDFHGFVEGNDIGAGTVDVVVTDGFTGNVALKTAEGTAHLYTAFLKEAFRTSILTRLGYMLARGSLSRLKERVDPRRYNGALFLGLGGVCVKSHGGTDGIGFANAIGVAVESISNSLNEKIKSGCEHVAPHLSSALSLQSDDGFDGP